MNKSLLVADNVERPFYYGVFIKGSKIHCVFSQALTITIICCNFSKMFPIMLALCLMLPVTYYAQNYAGIIGWSLVRGPGQFGTRFGASTNKLCGYD